MGKYSIHSVFNREHVSKMIALAIVNDQEFRENSGYGIAYPTKEEAYRFARDELFSGEGKIYLANAEGKIVGFFAVDRISQRHGTGHSHIHFFEKTKYLLRLTELFFKACKQDLGLHTLVGEYSANNKKVGVFARKVGFKTIGVIPRLYTFGDGMISYKVL